MSILARPAVASVAAKAMQRLVALGNRSGRASSPDRFPEFPGNSHEVTIPTSVAPARAVVYLPATTGTPAVHVNFHGGGFVMPLTDMDDSLCRFLAAEAGVAVVNVDYVLAPQHPFPAPTRQAYEVVRWIAEHGDWDGGRLTIGGQSAGGGLSAAVSRQALEDGGPSIALQVLHYPPLDLATNARDKHSVSTKPKLRPWMADVFDSAYVPNPRDRADRLVSPANPADTADLTGIAPALVLTAEFDILRTEGTRYAERLREVGALVEHVDIPGVDHGYDVDDAEKAREIYGLIARHIKQAANS
jgi:acetyl esterase/lipase